MKQNSGTVRGSNSEHFRGSGRVTAGVVRSSKYTKSSQYNRWSLLRWLPALALVLLVGCETISAPDENEPNAIALHPATAQLEEGDLFSVKVTDPTKSSDTPAVAGLQVSWESSDPSVATVAGGTVRGVAPGEARITAKTAGGKTASAQVTVTRTAHGFELLEGSGLEGEVGEDLSAPIEARVVSPRGLPVADVEVRFDVVKGAGSVSPVAAVSDDDGRVEVSWTLGTVAGEQAVNLRLVGGNGGTLPVVAEARPGPADRVEVVPEEVSLRPGSPFQFEAQVSDRFGNKLGNVPVQWSSSDDQVIQLNDAGWVTAVEPGEALVEADVMEGAAGVFSQLAASPGQGKGQGRVKVSDEEGSDATVAILGGNNQTGPVGQELSRELEIQVTDASGTPIRQQDVEWVVTGGGGQVSDARTRTNGQGRASTAWTVGTTPGGNTLEARVGSLGTAAFVATAEAGSVAEVRVSPTAATVNEDDEEQFSVEVLDAYGNVISDHSAPEWAVETASIAEIKSNGRARGLSRGTTGVRATVEGVSGSAELEVMAVEDDGSSDDDTTDGDSGDGSDDGAEVTAVSISPSGAEVYVGDTLQLSATATDQDGDTVSGVEFQWSTSDSSVATVNEMGRTIAKGVGTALIVAVAVCCEVADTVQYSVIADDPDRVTDLSVVATDEDLATLRWTEVEDGTGSAANYAIRYASPDFSDGWGAAYETEVSVEGSAVGSTLEYDLNGLEAGTQYEFRMVAYRGTLNEDATFGSLSNIADGETEGGSTEDDGGSEGDEGSDDGSSSDGEDGSTGDTGGSATPVFYDGFESGDNSKEMNGYRWVSTWGTPESASGDGAPVLEGEWSHRFRQLNDCGNSRNTHIRIEGESPDQHLDEFWFEYAIRIPDNYAHTCQGNNKWAEFFHPDSRGTTLVAPNTRRNDARDGGSRLVTYTQITDNSQSLSGSDAFVTTSDRGNWVRYRFYARRGTIGNADGALVIWKNGVKMYESQSLDISSPTEALNSFGAWQIMGWDNSGWPETITWYVDEVRLYADNPGW